LSSGGIFSAQRARAEHGTAVHPIGKSQARKYQDGETDPPGGQQGVHSPHSSSLQFRDNLYSFSRKKLQKVMGFLGSFLSILLPIGGLIGFPQAFCEKAGPGAFRKPGTAIGRSPSMIKFMEN
jgi:hypothetical protein